MALDKELNFRVYLFLKIRRVNNEMKDVSVFSIIALNEFLGLPNGTLNHFLKLRRLLKNDNLYIAESMLRKYFGFNPNRKLTDDELKLKEDLEIFN